MRTISRTRQRSSFMVIYIGRRKRWRLKIFAIDCTPDAAKCIAKCEITMNGDIPQYVIDTVLSEKCFDGKSFFEIQQDITVTVIH